MLEAYWLNLGSLILGLTAWILPIVRLMRRNKAGKGNVPLLFALSLGACALSLCLQIFYTDHLVKIEDWSALMDISFAMAWVSALLLAVTLLLNAIVLVSYYRGKPGNQ
jgi:cytochrome c oxidase subunit 4